MNSLDDEIIGVENYILMSYYTIKEDNDKMSKKISIDEKDIRFKIIPVYEKNKSFNGLDNVMRLVLLSEKNIGNRLLTLEETVRLVACNAPFVPIWINISLNRRENEKIVFNFETSLRLRKPSLLRNADTGHAPFKALK